MHCLDKETEQIGPVGKNVTLYNPLDPMAQFQIFFQNATKCPNATGMKFVGGDRDGIRINIGSCLITKIEAGLFSRPFQACKTFCSNGTNHYHFELTSNFNGTECFVTPMDWTA